MKDKFVIKTTNDKTRAPEDAPFTVFVEYDGEVFEIRAGDPCKLDPDINYFFNCSPCLANAIAHIITGENLPKDIPELLIRLNECDIQSVDSKDGTHVDLDTELLKYSKPDEEALNRVMADMVDSFIHDMKAEGINLDQLRFEFGISNGQDRHTTSIEYTNGVIKCNNQPR